MPDGIADYRTTKKPAKEVRQHTVAAAIIRIGPGRLGTVTLIFTLTGGCKPLQW